MGRKFKGFLLESTLEFNRKIIKLLTLKTFYQN
jgi:hypothetical protein